MVRRTVRRIRTFCEEAASRTLRKCGHGGTSSADKGGSAPTDADAPAKKAKVDGHVVLSSEAGDPVAELGSDAAQRGRGFDARHDDFPKKMSDNLGLQRAGTASTDADSNLENCGANDSDVLDYGDLQDFQDQPSWSDTDVEDSGAEAFDLAPLGAESAPLQAEEDPREPAAESAPSLCRVNFSGDYIVDHYIGDVDKFLKDCGVNLALRCALRSMRHGVGKHTTIKHSGDDYHVTFQTRAGTHSVDFVVDGVEHPLVEPLFGKVVGVSHHWASNGEAIITKITLQSGRPIPEMRRYLKDDAMHIELSSPSGMKLVRVLTRRCTENAGSSS